MRDLDAVTGTAVSAQKSGLLPLKRFGITSHGQIAYHDYDGPGFRPEERTKFVTDLGDKRMMFLRNHAALTHDRSIAERSCEIQIAAQSGRGELVAAAGRYYQKNDADRAGSGRPTFRRSRFRRGCSPAQPDRSYLSRLSELVAAHQ